MDSGVPLPVWRSTSLRFRRLFEVFVCQIYAYSLQQDLSFGGARYIGTGRGFATARMPFGVLYSRFAGPSIYLGARCLMMLLFGTLTVWGYWLLWFWVSLLALCISPFLFNPHQFAWADFFIDYREFLRWLSRGNTKAHSASWIGFVRLSRTRLTGFKRKALGEPSAKLSGDTPRAKFTNVFFSEITGPFVFVLATVIPFVYINSGTGVYEGDQPKNSNPDLRPTNSLIRVGIIALAPIAINGGVAIGFFAMACCMGPILSICCKKFGAVLAAIAHAIAVIMMLVLFEAMYFLESFNFVKTLLGMIAVVAIQRWILKLIVALALTREFRADTSNIAWWTGKWYALGWHTISQPGREFLCKITEMSFFAGDFILGHIILFLLAPALLVPYIDKFHSVMLFWLRPRYVPRCSRFSKNLTNAQLQPSNPPSNLLAQAIKAPQASRRPLRHPLLLHVLTLPHPHHRSRRCWSLHRAKHQPRQLATVLPDAAVGLEAQRYHELQANWY